VYLYAGLCSVVPALGDTCVSSFGRSLYEVTVCLTFGDTCVYSIGLYMYKIKDKRILITGTCGTVGSEVVKALLTSNEYQPASVIGIDNNESELFFIDQLYLDDARVNFHMADIRDRDVLTRLMQDVDIVFHAAALKHVILCERAPHEAVQTNLSPMSLDVPILVTTLSKPIEPV